jgi:hypothetical protein
MKDVIVHELRIADIVIRDRYRKDLGDIPALAESIKRLGLFQPIAVTPNLELIFGARRIAAFKHLGRQTILARTLDIRSILEGEYDENETRKDFTISEKVALARAIEKELKGRNRRPPKSPEPVPDLQKGETRDLVAERVGLGTGRTYDHAKAVVDNGTPELVAAVDAGEVAIKPAAEFAKQEPEQQTEQIAAVRGDVKAAIAEFRKNLPTRQEARKVAAETGAVILGKDGRFHTDATDDERAKGEAYLRVASALRSIRDLDLSPEEILASVPSGSQTLFGHLIDQTAEFILLVQSKWRSRYVA